MSTPEASSGAGAKVHWAYVCGAAKERLPTIQGRLAKDGINLAGHCDDPRLFHVPKNATLILLVADMVGHEVSKKARTWAKDNDLPLISGLWRTWSTTRERLDLAGIIPGRAVLVSSDGAIIEERENGTNGKHSNGSSATLAERLGGAKLAELRNKLESGEQLTGRREPVVEKPAIKVCPKCGKTDGWNADKTVCHNTHILNEPPPAPSPESECDDAACEVHEAQHEAARCPHGTIPPAACEHCGRAQATTAQAPTPATTKPEEDDSDWQAKYDATQLTGGGEMEVKTNRGASKTDLGRASRAVELIKDRKGRITNDELSKKLAKDFDGEGISGPVYQRCRILAGFEPSKRGGANLGNRIKPEEQAKLLKEWDAKYAGGRRKSGTHAPATNKNATPAREVPAPASAAGANPGGVEGELRAIGEMLKEMATKYHLPMALIKVEKGRVHIDYEVVQITKGSITV